MTQQSYLLTLLFFVTLAPFVNGQSSTSTTFDPQSATVTIASFPPFTSEPYTCVRECLDHGGDNDLLYTMGCGPGAVNSCYCQLTSGALYTSRPFSIISGCIYDWCGQSHATESSATTEVSYAQSVYLAYCTQALNVAAAITASTTAAPQSVSSTTATPQSGSSSNSNLHLILGLAVGLGGGALVLFVLLTIFCLYKRRKGQTLNKGNAEDPAEVVDKDEVNPKPHTSPLKELDSTERDPQMEQAFNRFTQQ